VLFQKYQNIKLHKSRLLLKKSLNSETKWFCRVNAHPKKAIRLTHQHCIACFLRKSLEWTYVWTKATTMLLQVGNVALTIVAVFQWQSWFVGSWYGDGVCLCDLSNWNIATMTALWGAIVAEACYASIISMLSVS